MKNTKRKYLTPGPGLHFLQNCLPDIQDGPGNEPVLAYVSPSVGLNGQRQAKED